MLLMEWDAEKRWGLDSVASHTNVHRSWLWIATLLFPQPLPPHIQTKRERWVHHTMLDDTFGTTIDTNADPATSPTYRATVNGTHKWAHAEILSSVKPSLSSSLTRIVSSHEGTFSLDISGFDKCDHSFVVAPPGYKVGATASCGSNKDAQGQRDQLDRGNKGT